MQDRGPACLSDSSLAGSGSHTLTGAAEPDLCRRGDRVRLVRPPRAPSATPAGRGQPFPGAGRRAYRGRRPGPCGWCRRGVIGAPTPGAPMDALVCAVELLRRNAVIPKLNGGFNPVPMRSAAADTSACIGGTSGCGGDTLCSPYARFSWTNAPNFRATRSAAWSEATLVTESGLAFPGQRTRRPALNAPHFSAGPGRMFDSR